ncbi:MAG TPA: amidase [Noviherbaspirillum sp.]|nr:amidase [Noviherbaspirillum sp.]
MQKTDETAFLPATALAAAIRNRELGSRELLEHYLQRVERFNHDINAIVTLDIERARRRADLADAAIARGESWGPLHGVPMTVKDAYETEGIRTTAGATPFSAYVPSSNAAAVQRLLGAGAVIFGKTNVPTFSMDVQTYNPIFGTTNNPWDLSRSPGGSSGGAAAALAAGLSALELGSDLAGSIRLPAHYCGVYGHKPSHGLVSLRGHIPGPPGTLSEPDIAVAGPLARAPEDLALALDILAGPEVERAAAWSLRLPPPRRERLREFRVAAWFDAEECPIGSEVRTCYQELLAALRAEGVTVDENARPAFGFAHAHRTFVSLLLSATSPGVPAEQFRWMAAQAEQLAEDDHGPGAGFLRGTTLRHRDWLSINEARLRLRAAWADFFRNYDVLLCPVAPGAALAHDHSEPMHARTILIDGKPQSYLRTMDWAGVIGVAHLPATVAPVGQTPGGLPVGIQIVGPYLEDRTPIAFAQRLAEAVGGFRMPRGY